MQSILMLLIMWIYFFITSHVTTESCNGAIVKNGTNQTIVDSNNETWIIDSDDKIYKNGEPAGVSGYVILLVYWDRLVYQQNQFGGWWKWVKDSPPWADAGDPRPSSHSYTASGCPVGPSPATTTDQQAPTTISNQIYTSTKNMSTVTSTSLIYSRSKSITTRFTTEKTMTLSTGKLSSLYFVSTTCHNSSYIGGSCNISAKPCDIQMLCHNAGTCTNVPDLPHGYSCACQSGFIGINCKSDIRLCKSNTCLHKGICTELNNTNFHCNCTRGRTGTRCELLVDYCHNVICLNNGICQGELLGYKCQCLFGTSGLHCENITTSLLIRQYVSKGFAYVAIIVLIMVAGFIIVLDILKYVFGIDPVHEECERLRRKRFLLKRKNHQKPNV